MASRKSNRLPNVCHRNREQTQERIRDRQTEEDLQDLVPAKDEIKLRFLGAESYEDETLEAVNLKMEENEAERSAASEVQYLIPNPT